MSRARRPGQRVYVKGNREPLKGGRHRFAFRKAIGCRVEVGGCKTAGGDIWY